MQDHLMWPLVCTVFIAAGLVKGVTGMGLPTLAMALLGLWMPPATAATLMLLPSLATNIAQCTGPHWRDLLRRLWPMWLALVIVTIASPWPSAGMSAATARAGLGVVLLGYGTWGLVRPSLPDWSQAGPAACALAGALSGVATAATGVFVMPLVPFLQAVRFRRDALVQALGISFALATSALAVRLGRDGGGNPPVPLALQLAAATAAFAGLGAGALLRQRLPAALFQRALYAVCAMLGTLMLWRA